MATCSASVLTRTVARLFRAARMARSKSGIRVSVESETAFLLTLTAPYLLHSHAGAEEREERCRPNRRHVGTVLAGRD
eukprot:337751-Prymnesium_polylepis.1